MCGIVAVVRRRTETSTPEPKQVLDLLKSGHAAFETPMSPTLAESLVTVAQHLSEANSLLSGEPGVRCLLENDELPAAIVSVQSEIQTKIADVEAMLEAEGDKRSDMENINSGLIAVKDAAWAISRDRLRSAVEILDLVGDRPLQYPSVPWLLSMQQTLSNIDRLEVRGRDSAGVNILVSGHDLDLDSPELMARVKERNADPLFKSGSVRLVEGNIGFVYKAAAEIGELGDNTAEIRDGIRHDDLLHEALAGANATATVLAHTRWASIGIVSEANAHPVNSEEVGNQTGPYLTAVLNGDVDNFADLKTAEGLDIAREITTDTKVIPTLISRNLASELTLDEAVRSAVCQFEGSVAIGISTAGAPEDLHLALRGSGQGSYIGIAKDAFIVASEPYGVVEDALEYIRMDGETELTPGNPGSQGQIVRLVGKKAGDPSGVERYSYDGSDLEIKSEEWKKPEITTRDIDRGDAPHFLLKEISESPVSFAKTLRGRLVSDGDKLTVQLPEESIPAQVKDLITSGDLKRVEVIGQGTAAVAGQAIAVAISDALAGAEVNVRAITATELSGFQIRDDMSDTLIVAVSQSGTTTDTNRTVDVVKARGALVVGIVNRRGSDLSDKAHGIIYTSDGRDVEMSVASTKAFYAQIASGFLLADVLSQSVPGAAPAYDRQELLTGLRELPKMMTETLGKREVIAEAASKHAPPRRYWAIVGNGSNKVAAEEIRIKLSELCYKAIPCDVTEDKKHIDLSSEPLILICAAGLTGSNADDVAKEVAIFSAHKAAPIVIATEGEERFNAALNVIGVPETHGSLAFILSTMVGHLFGYEAALAIDESARPLREVRGAIEDAVETSTEGWFGDFSKQVRPLATKFFTELRKGTYNGHLEASTAIQVSTLLRFASQQIPLDLYQAEFDRVGTPGVVVEDLALGLTTAIEELTRPIDAIKHQAKTVTVGISRADESLLQSMLTTQVLATGVDRDSLSYKSLRTLAAVAPGVATVDGFTRYKVSGDLDESPEIAVIAKGGTAENMTSRAESDPTLRGTKRRVAVERLPIVTVGTDNKTVLIIPEVKGSQTIGLTLCHLTLLDKMPAEAARSTLQNYRNRYRQLTDVVTESTADFDDSILGNVPTVELLTAPISEVAEHWA